MKKIVMLATGLALCWAAAVRAAVTVELEPAEPSPGRISFLIIRSDEGRPRLLDFPALENGRWISRESVRSGTSTSIVNGRRTDRHEVGYPIAANRPGELKIPELKVEAAGKVHTIAGRTVRVPSPGEAAVAPGGTGREGRSAEAVRLDEVVFGRLAVASPRREFYVGEEVPLVLRLYVREDFAARARVLEYPVLEIPHAVFRDLGQVNPENPRFLPPGPTESQEIDGRNFRIWSVRSFFRSIASGEVKPSASVRVGIQEGGGQRRGRSLFDDEFFDGFFGASPQLTPYAIPFEGHGALRFRPLPELAEDADFLGLIGDWQLEIACDAADPVKAGELFNLTVRLKGGESSETLKAPALELPGFRCYPPEVRRGVGGAAEISYALIPLQPGTRTLALKLATFDPETGKYQSSAFERQFTVLPGDRSAAGTVAGEVGGEPAAAADAAAHERTDDIFYIRKAPSGAVRLPVWRHRLPLALLSAAAGPLLLAAAALFGLRRRRRGSAGARRGQLRRRIGAKQAELQRLSDAEFERRFNLELLPLLAEYGGLPPGSTAAEVAAALDDPEFAAALRACGEGAYCPTAAAEKGEFRRRLAAALKKLPLLLLLALPAGVRADAFADGMAAYDRGDFRAAGEYYAAGARDGELDAARSYNLGCVAYMLQDYPGAILHFERARRLRPGDSEALENLNLARRRLGLGPVGRVASPYELLLYCRDSLRPDGWLLLAAAGVFAVCLALLLRRRLGNRVGFIAGFAALALVLLALAAAAAQQRGPYSGRRAIVLAAGAEVKTLPGPTGRREGEIPGGREVRIIESRPDYTLLRFGQRTGWVATGALERVWR